MYRDGQGIKCSNYTALCLAFYLHHLSLSYSTIRFTTAENICCSQLYLTSPMRILPIAGIQLISDEWMKLLLKPTFTVFHVPPTGHSLCYQGCPLRILYKELRGKTLAKICKREKEYIHVCMCVCVYVCEYSEDPS